MEVEQVLTITKQWLFEPTVIKFTLAVAGLLLTRALISVVNHHLAPYITEAQTRYRVRKLVTFVGYVVALLYFALVFRTHLGGLTIALGVAGAGIAFALQEVIVSIAGWVAISFGHFYAIGDRIQLGGIKGDVIDIGILRTALMECGEWVRGDQYTGRIVRVGNSHVFREPVFNYSADFPFLWDEISVPVKYGEDHQLARQLLNQVINEVVRDYTNYAKQSWRDVVRRYMIDEAMVDPVVMLVCNDNWMEFTLRYIVDYKRRRRTKDLIFTRILEEFDQNGIALASATFQLVDPPVFDVRVSGKLDQ
ncbi:MAG: mechanosensitive ion channel [Desulfobacca sp.]|nr:mechanosensitive ion channel [Desulfobacca sp.]